ncbi:MULTISPECIES: DNA-processing protein DprA [Psychrobacter]|uniref:DNA-processing protein DprA n=1 Tax=Psychrobacter TaxID=497 RepID=UPI00146F32C0|nr:MULTISPECIES: DNA-processing protein DprA [Psychrobacter]
MTVTMTADNRSALALWFEVNCSLSAYQKLMLKFGSALSAWQASASEWQQLGIHKLHIERHKDNAATLKFIETIEIGLARQKYQLIFADHPDFPLNLLELFDPPPLIFYQGNIKRLVEPQIAIVGSRKPSAHAQKITFDLAQYLAQSGLVITSGLAMGVDKRAHLGALLQSDPRYQGRTIGVMGTGIDVCYPNHHDQLIAQIIDQGGCIISELLPKTPPQRHTFPRRNRLVAGLSAATIVTEAALKSGSLITARLASEQGKQVFAVPSHIDNVNAEGCHHLIREGATLIYHPDQVLMDVSWQLPTAVTANVNDAPYEKPLLPKRPAPSNTTDNQPKAVSYHVKKALPQALMVPDHLNSIYQRLDWHGQDLDALVTATKISPPELIGQLMELELLGAIREQGGRYLRV